MTPAARILIVDDDRAFRLSTAALLRDDGYEIISVADGAEAVRVLQQQRFDLMLLDMRLPGTDGLHVVEALRLWGESIPILMISGFGTVQTAVEALHLGADDFLTKPVEPEMLSARIAELLERRPGNREDTSVGFAGMVGRTPAMRDVYDAIRRVAPTDATVLITGETGTGKELVARAIHDQSSRAAGPFLAVNCAALAEGLLESELFGHVRGSFTGAIADKRGLFEAAEGGTLFLDEVGDMSPGLQQRLLRVLQDREIRPVGAVRNVAIDVRVVAATRRDLHAANTQFREDLYYRLNVFPIALPALRDRAADIPLIVERTLAGMRRTRPRLSCSPLAMRALRAYQWPGNVRELLAVLESAAIRADGDRIEAQHLPREVRERDGATESLTDRYRLVDSPADERSAIRAALDAAGGNRARTAELLGMGRTTLWRKMKQYGIEALAEPPQ